MGINLTRYFKSEGQKASITTRTAETAFDRPTFKGFAYVFKSNSPMVPDRAVQGFSTNSAFVTRLQGTKLW